MQPLTRSLAIALLVGTVLLGVGAMFHPILPHDRPGQLRLIAATWYFRPVHLAMLAGSALIIARVWTRALIGPARRRCSRRSRSCALGLCFNAIDIAFMGKRGESATPVRGRETSAGARCSIRCIGSAS